MMKVPYIEKKENLWSILTNGAFVNYVNKSVQVINSRRMCSQLKIKIIICSNFVVLPIQCDNKKKKQFLSASNSNEVCRSKFKLRIV